MKEMALGKIKEDNKDTVIQKLRKAAGIAMVEKRAIKGFTKKLAEGSKKKEAGEGKRSKGNYGKARVLGQEEVNRIDAELTRKEEQKRKDNEAKALKAAIAASQRFFALIKREHNICMLTPEIFAK
jgi:hypothetical protein